MAAEQLERDPLIMSAGSPPGVLAPEWSEVGYGGASWGRSSLGGASGGEAAGMFLGTHTPRLDDKGRLACPPDSGPTSRRAW